MSDRSWTKFYFLKAQEVQALAVLADLVGVQADETPLLEEDHPYPILTYTDDDCVGGGMDLAVMLAKAGVTFMHHWDGYTNLYDGGVGYSDGARHEEFLAGIGYVPAVEFPECELTDEVVAEIRERLAFARKVRIALGDRL